MRLVDYLKYQSEKFTNYLYKPGLTHEQRNYGHCDDRKQSQTIGNW